MGTSGLGDASKPNHEVCVLFDLFVGDAAVAFINDSQHVAQSDGLRQRAEALATLQQHFTIYNINMHHGNINYIHTFKVTVIFRYRGAPTVTVKMVKTNGANFPLA